MTISILSYIFSLFLFVCDFILSRLCLSIFGLVLTFRFFEEISYSDSKISREINQVDKKILKLRFVSSLGKLINHLNSINSLNTMSTSTAFRYDK